jgi:excisionase family DNA binding protein
VRVLASVPVEAARQAARHALGDGIHNATAPRPTLLLNLDEVATELRCTRRCVERHIADHRLPVIWIGRSVRIERQALEAFIASLRAPDDGY